MEDDEKFAISDSLQSYIDDIQKNSGYQNQDKLEKAGIRQEIINSSYPEIQDLKTSKLFC